MPDFPTNGHAANAEAPVEDRKPPLIPSHIAWPGFVIFLLLLGIGTAFQALFAARSDGGARVVENYYDAAQRFDETQATQAASDALGWTTAVSIGACEATGCPVELAVTDGEDVPVTGLVGRVAASRPQDTQAQAEAALREVQPGVYRQTLRLGPSLWDFAVDARRGDDHYVTAVRREIR